MRVIRKCDILEQLRRICDTNASSKRVLALETQFHACIADHVASLPVGSSKFARFNTNPFVLMIHNHQRGYSHIHQMENDILPAKQFSSMETFAGTMVQEVTLPAYRWQNVKSSMQSSRSAIDGMKKGSHLLRLATLKSGPRCLNDEMSKDLAADIVDNAERWARETKVDHVEFSYGVLYGTEKQSNKKDWHILRNITEMVGERFVEDPPDGKWRCTFKQRGIRIDVNVRIGMDWWSYLGGKLALTEVLVALIRACVDPSPVLEEGYAYEIGDLGDITSMSSVPLDFNVGLLQRSQLPWLFFLSRHYCDELTD